MAFPFDRNRADRVYSQDVLSFGETLQEDRLRSYFRLGVMIVAAFMLLAIPAMAQYDYYDEDYGYAEWYGSINGGWAMAMGDLDDNFDDGFCVEGDLEYRFDENWTADGFVGWRNLAADAGGNADMDVLNISINGKYYFTPGEDTFWLRGGVGWYDPDMQNTDDEFGFNFGFGYLFGLDDEQVPGSGLKVGVDYHWVDFDNADSEWLEFLVGWQFAW
jgi:hypothetical protein